MAWPPPTLPPSPISCLHRVVNSPFSMVSPSGHAHGRMHRDAGSGPAVQQQNGASSPGGEHILEHPSSLKTILSWRGQTTLSDPRHVLER